jgi:hypothetical protein
VRKSEVNALRGMHPWLLMAPTSIVLAATGGTTSGNQPNATQ